MEGIVSIIANLGFPIAISVRIESKMEKLTESINELSNTIASLDGAGKK